MTKTNYFLSKIFWSVQLCVFASAIGLQVLVSSWWTLHEYGANIRILAISLWVIIGFIVTVVGTSAVPITIIFFRTKVFSVKLVMTCIMFIVSDLVLVFISVIYIAKGVQMAYLIYELSHKLESLAG